MVVLLDLDLDHDSDDEDPGHQLSVALQQQLSGLQQLRLRQPSVGAVGNHNSPPLSRRSPNTVNAGLFASALACYPVALSLASCLDLNDLFALSSTCHQVHDCLIQFAQRLRVASLQCINDRSLRASIQNNELEVRPNAYDHIVEEPGYIEDGSDDPATNMVSFDIHASYHHGGNPSFLGLTGRFGKCARDLVAPCRKCGVTVCRNCAIKPPTARYLPDRFRRLCRTCLEAPLSDHLQQLTESSECYDSPSTSRASSTKPGRSLSTGSVLSGVSTEEGQTDIPTFTTSAFLRTPCECDSRGVYLCQPCGQNLSSANTTYKRVWTWRSRYSTHIGGGLGTGLGQGEQGQKCGRGNHCLEKGAAGICWMEIECSESRGADGYPEPLSGSRTHSTVFSDPDLHGSSRNKPGYFSQEMEGIGGVVKKKVRKRVKVGATVYEFDDERESGKYLERESSGQTRSWCGWCFRVCPGGIDLPIVEQMLC